MNVSYCTQFVSWSRGCSYECIILYTVRFMEWGLAAILFIVGQQSISPQKTLFISRRHFIKVLTSRKTSIVYRWSTVSLYITLDPGCLYILDPGLLFSLHNVTLGLSTSLLHHLSLILPPTCCRFRPLVASFTQHCFSCLHKHKQLLCSNCSMAE